MFTNLIEALLTDIVKESLDVLGKCRTDACLRDSLCLISKGSRPFSDHDPKYFFLYWKFGSCVPWKGSNSPFPPPMVLLKDNPNNIFLTQIWLNE